MQTLFYYKCGECEKLPLVYDENKGELFLLIIWISYCR